MKSKQMQHYPITIQSHHESNHIPITESCGWGAWCTKCWRGGQCCPLPKLHPPAWRGTLTPDIISQPVSPRPRKKRWIQIHELKGTRKDPNREAQRWFHLSFLTAEAQAGAGSIFLSAQRTNGLALDPSLLPPIGIHTQGQ